MSRCVRPRALRSSFNRVASWLLLDFMHLPSLRIKNAIVPYVLESRTSRLAADERGNDDRNPDDQGRDYYSSIRQGALFPDVWMLEKPLVQPLGVALRTLLKLQAICFQLVVHSVYYNIFAMPKIGKIIFSYFPYCTVSTHML